MTQRILTILSIVLVLFSMFALLPGCGGGGGGGGTGTTGWGTNNGSSGSGGTATPIQTPVPMATFAGTPNENVTPLNSQTQANLQKIEGDNYFFGKDATDTKNLNPGTIIIGNQNEGFLRKVKSVGENGDYIVVNTETATLEDVFKETENFGIEKKLSPDDVVEEHSLKGVTLKQEKRGTFSLNFNKTIVESSANIVFDGSLTIEPSVNCNMSFKSSRLDTFYFNFSTTETAELKLTIDKNVSAGEEWELAKYRFSPIVIMVGPVPVVFVPELTIKGGINAEVNGSMESSITQTAKFNAGAEYKEGNWNNLNQYNNNFNYSLPTLSAGLDAKAYIKPELSLKLYSIVGPTAGVSGYLRLHASPSENPWWGLYGGINGEIGITIDILSMFTTSYNSTLFEYETLIAGPATPEPTPTPTTSPTPTPTPSPTTIQSSFENKIIFNSNRSGTFGTYIIGCDDPPGSEKVLFDTSGDDENGAGFNRGISPDYQSCLIKSDQHLYLVDINGNIIRTLIDDGHYKNYYATFSRDGSKVAFISVGGSEPVQIREINADGTGLRTITSLFCMSDATLPSSQTHIYHGIFVDYSPDGKKLVFSDQFSESQSDVSDLDIFTINCDGSDRTVLYASSSTDCVPCYSSDGSKIFFSSYKNGDGQIFSLDLSTYSTKQLTFDGVNTTPSVFAPGFIVFVSRRTGSSNTYKMNYDGSNQIPVADSAYFNRSLRNLLFPDYK
ncbi:MAG: TolB family protein [Candidatus Xenobiia bacterium LiM19]